MAQNDTQKQSLVKDIPTTEMIVVWIFGLIGGLSVMVSFNYVSAMEDFAAPPFLIAMLVGIAVVFVLAVIYLIGHVIFRRGAK